MEHSTLRLLVPDLPEPGQDFTARTDHVPEIEILPRLAAAHLGERGASSGAYGLGPYVTGPVAFRARLRGHGVPLARVLTSRVIAATPPV